MAQHCARERPIDEGSAPVHVRLPADVAQALTAIAPSPVDAVRQLLEVAVPKPGSEGFCRRHLCIPEVPLARPERWACATCGLVGRSDWPFNPYMAARLTGAAERALALRDTVADLYARLPGGERFTLTSWAADQRDLPRRERRQAKAERTAALTSLVEHGLLEEASGPRGGTGYRTLEEPPDWLADLLADRRAEREAEDAAQRARAEAIQRAIAEGLPYTAASGVCSATAAVMPVLL